MPTIRRIGACRIVVYPNDHRPAHVHIIGEGCEAVFKLNCPKGPPELRENFGFKPAMLGAFLTELKAEVEVLCEEWRNIHGYP